MFEKNTLSFDNSLCRFQVETTLQKRVSLVQFCGQIKSKLHTSTNLVLSFEWEREELRDSVSQWSRGIDVSDGECHIGQWKSECEKKCSEVNTMNANVSSKAIPVQIRFKIKMNLLNWMILKFIFEFQFVGLWSMKDYFVDGPNGVWGWIDFLKFVLKKRKETWLPTNSNFFEEWLNFCLTITQQNNWWMWLSLRKNSKQKTQSHKTTNTKLSLTSKKECDW